MASDERPGGPRPRLVTLVVCRRDGTISGALPPFEVVVPWWQEVGPVVAGVQDRFGLDVTILRLLTAEADRTGEGGPVTYLAEVEEHNLPVTRPWEGNPNAEEPLRASWAQPGGPADDCAWADDALERAGLRRVGHAQQVRTWNLSSLWRLPTAGGAAWLKVVPPFFAHEGAVLSLLPPAPVPEVIAFDGPRLLLDGISGEDQYGATGDALVSMVDLLVPLQGHWAGRTDELLHLGAPDWRSEALTGPLADLVARCAPTLAGDDLGCLHSLVDDLPSRFERIAACGLPDTLVHGDFHPGNVRGTGGDLVLLDWGDCGVGHPMLDQPAFLERLSGADRALVRTAWTRRWREEVPGCDPERAAALFEPVAALRQALIYQGFLDRIEPDERIYHAADPQTWLERAVELAARAAG